MLIEKALNFSGFFLAFWPSSKRIPHLLGTNIFHYTSYNPIFSFVPQLTQEIGLINPRWFVWAFLKRWTIISYLLTTGYFSTPHTTLLTHHLAHFTNRLRHWIKKTYTYYYSASTCSWDNILSPQVTNRRHIFKTLKDCLPTLNSQSHFKQSHDAQAIPWFSAFTSNNPVSNNPFPLSPTPILTTYKESN